MNISAVSKPIFTIKATEDKTKIYTPKLSGPGQNVLSFLSMSKNAYPKIRGGGLTDYSRTSRSRGSKFGSSTGRSEFETFHGIKT